MKLSQKRGASTAEPVRGSHISKAVQRMNERTARQREMILEKWTNSRTVAELIRRYGRRRQGGRRPHIAEDLYAHRRPCRLACPVGPTLSPASSGSYKGTQQRHRFRGRRPTR